MPYQKSFALAENKNVQKILALIQSRELRAGERLPTERELVALLGIGRNSLREALKVLETMGVVMIRHGSGIYLCKTDISPRGDSALWLVIHRDEILQMLTVREALDLKAIELIPEAEFPSVRARLLQCLEAERRTGGGNEDLLRHDLEFHSIIREASGNDILLNICSALTGTIYDERQVLFRRPGRAEQSLREHQQIADAFGSGDRAQIGRAYVLHLASTRAGIESAAAEGPAAP